MDAQQYDWGKIATAAVVLLVVWWLWKRYIRESFDTEVKGVDYKTAYPTAPPSLPAPIPERPSVPVAADLTDDGLTYAPLDVVMPSCATGTCAAHAPVVMSAADVRTPSAATSSADLEPAGMMFQH